MAKERSISLFLRMYEQELLPNEEVFHVAQNSIKPVKGSFVYFVIWLICAFILPGNILVISAIFLSLLYLFLEYLINASRKKEQTICLITSEGIRMDEGLIEWKAVYDIETFYNLQTQYLVFHFYPDNEAIDRHDLNYEMTYFDQGYMFLGSNYNAFKLKEQILPYWEPVAPSYMINRVNQYFAQQYNFEIDESSPTEISYNGTINNIKLACSFDKLYPHEKVRVSTKLPRQITNFLSIVAFPGSRSAGKNNIKIGDEEIDNKYQFLSSNPEQIEQLFTDDVINQFKELTMLGQVDWSFGQPLKKEKLRSNISSMKDSEDVLDTGLLKLKSEQAQEYKITDNASYDTLELNGTLDLNSEGDLEKVQEFMVLATDLSVLLSKQLMAYDNNPD